MIGSGPGGQVVSNQGYGGTAIVSTDGRTVTVGQFGTSCPTKVTAVARETATRVALFLQFLTPDNPPPCPQAAASRVPSQQIRLRALLGSRKLVDGATGKATAWISARLVLRPTVLPAGYRLTDLIPAVDLAGRKARARPDACSSTGGRPVRTSWRSRRAQAACSCPDRAGVAGPRSGCGDIPAVPPAT